MEAKQKSRLLNAYYKRKFHKGKSIFARIVDFIFVRFIACAVLFLWFSSLISNTVLIAVLTAVSLGVFCVFAALLTSILFTRAIKKERLRIAEKLYSERLAILDKNGFTKIVEYCIQHNPSKYKDSLLCVSQCKGKLSEELMLRICRKARSLKMQKVTIFCISGATDEAAAMCEQYKIEVKTVCAKALMPFAKNILPSDDEIDAAITEYEQAYREKRKKLAASPLAPIKAKRYWLMALILFIASFFVRYALYYRILGGACLCFAVIVQQLRYERTEL